MNTWLEEAGTISKETFDRLRRVSIGMPRGGKGVRLLPWQIELRRLAESFAAPTVGECPPRGGRRRGLQLRHIDRCVGKRSQVVCIGGGGYGGPTLRALRVLRDELVIAKAWETHGRRIEILEDLEPLKHSLDMFREQALAITSRYDRHDYTHADLPTKTHPRKQGKRYFGKGG